MQGSRGLRLSAIGGVVVIVGGLALLLLPDLVAGAAMLVGAMAVGTGFVWTMTEFYVKPPEPPADS